MSYSSSKCLILNSAFWDNVLHNWHILPSEIQMCIRDRHYTAPHSPWEEEEHPAEYIERYRSCPFDSVPEKEPHPRQIPTAPMGTGEHRKELLRGYYAAITAMDHGVGSILDFLQMCIRDRGGGAVPHHRHGLLGKPGA